MSYLQYLLLVTCLIFLGLSVYQYRSDILSWFIGEPASVVRIGEANFRVAIADTPEERQQGLSGRTGLDEFAGLLFVFPTDGRHGFWMKDMNFSIDMFWIAADGRIVHIERNVAPDTYPTIFRPDRPARYVLETNQGMAGLFNITVGQYASLPDVPGIVE